MLKALLTQQELVAPETTLLHLQPFSLTRHSRLQQTLSKELVTHSQVGVMAQHYLKQVPDTQQLA
jgi:hypothetical protein